MTFHILVTTGGQKTEKMAKSTQTKNLNLNMDIKYKCHIINSKQSETIDYFCSQIHQVSLRREITYFVFAIGND
jgi:hypothetical protein